jgi:hypothetical protein
MINIFVGQLVENWALAFGRVTFFDGMHFEITWGYSGEKTFFSATDTAGLKFYNKEETAYL